MQQDRGQFEEEPFRFVLAHQTMLKACIFSMVRNRHDAEDLLSDVMLQIVRTWDQYDRSRPFAPWARGVARRFILAHLRRVARAPVFFEEGVLEQLSQYIGEAGEERELGRRKEALALCMERLSLENQNLLRCRYFDGESYDEMSHTTHRTVGALYIVFSRLNKVLMSCVEKELNSI